jgi:hypothetical protein
MLRYSLPKTYAILPRSFDYFGCIHVVLLFSIWSYLEKITLRSSRLLRLPRFVAIGTKFVCPSTAVLISCGALLCASGCLPSIYPLYLTDDCVIEDEAIGIWAIERRLNTLKFVVERHSDECFYRLRLVQDDRGVLGGNLIARLARVGPHLFADVHHDPEDIGISLDEDSMPAWDMINFVHFFPVHQIFWIDQTERDTIVRGGTDNGDELQSLCVDRGLTISSVNEDLSIITSPTSDFRTCLQALSVDELYDIFGGGFFSISLRKIEKQ